MKKFNQFKIFLLIVLIAALGGGNGVLAKVGLREISPLNFTFWRFLSALIFLLPIFFIQKQKFTFLAFKKLFWILLFAAGNIIIFIFAIRLTTASASQILYTFSPLLAGILSYLLLGDKLGTKKILGVLIGFIGTIVIILLPVITGDSSLNGSLAGNLLILLAVLSHSIYTVLSKDKQKDFTPVGITTYSAVFTLIFSAILIPLDHGSFDLTLSNSVLFSVLYSGIAATALFYLLYQYVIKISSPLAASTVLYVEPIFTIIWAVIVLSEKITTGLLFGMILVILGVYLATGQRKSIQTQ